MPSVVPLFPSPLIDGFSRYRQNSSKYHKIHSVSLKAFTFLSIGPCNCRLSIPNLSDRVRGEY